MALCAGLAGLPSFFLHDNPIKPVVPLLFLLVVIPIAHLLGTLAAFMGATVASFIFVFFLFPPFGSLAVREMNDRILLISFQVVATGLSYLAAPRPSRDSKLRTSHNP
jgi:K+-sensing histidine kinase KdpD